MRLQNGLELSYNKESETVRFSKLINNKLRYLDTKCKSCKMLFALSQGYSSYGDKEFLDEIQATNI